MFQASRAPLHRGSVTCQLGRLPAGSHVQLSFGDVWWKPRHRWLRAGWICTPLTHTALAALNKGLMPTPVWPAWTPQEAS